jgi:hypothetical protein
MTVDPLHLIQIMLAQGSGCRQVNVCQFQRRVRPPFQPGMVGFAFLSEKGPARRSVLRRHAWQSRGVRSEKDDRLFGCRRRSDWP